MKRIRWYIVGIILFMLVISSFVVYAKNTTLKTELFFWDGANQSLALSMTWVMPWNSYNFDVKINNVWDVPAIVHMGFVDGTVTNDSYANKACLNEWNNSKLGQYISWPNDFVLSGRDSVIKTYTLSLPIWYIYSGDISACITHYPSVVNDTGMFGMQARRANFLDIYVVPWNSSGDLISPIIQSINPLDWQSNVWNDSNIVITFSELMSGVTVESSILLSPSIWFLLYSWSGNILTISHSSSFVYSTNYTLTIGTWTQDLAWNAISNVYTSSFNIESDPWSSWWWWGWWWGWWWWGGAIPNKPIKDNCPDGDDSGDVYDGDCGEYAETEEDVDKEHWSSASYDRECSVDSSNYSAELDQAYIFACNMGITTMPSIDKADMMWPLLRKHLAKMISEFSIQVLWNSPELTKRCEFTDMWWESKEMQYYAKTACQLYLMWLHPDGVTPKNVFDPNDIVTRAEFWTVLSRLLWLRQYASNSWELFYLRHLEALKTNAIMTQIYGDRPTRQELRWWVMLMLMRVNENKMADAFNLELWHAAQWWLVAMLDEWSLDVEIETFGDNPYYTDKDFVPIKWKINSDNISKIRVTHIDSNWVWVYNNYYLKKFNPWDDKFVFYAYKYYNSLTINDMNRYKFEFFDQDNALIFVKTVWIDHNYVENR